MPTVNRLSNTYNNEYKDWRLIKDLNSAKRQEYLRRNPESIKDYDLQRAKTLLSIIDIMDKSTLNKTEGANTLFESLTNFGLGYAAVGGTTLGFLLTKLKPIQKNLKKIISKYPKSKNIITMGVTVTSGILGLLAAYPIYTSLSKIESKIYRKRRFETMENELQDPKIFAVLNENQKTIFEKNIQEIETQNRKKNLIKSVKKDFKTLKQITNEAIYYEKEQNLFKEKYNEDKKFYENELNEKEIKDAKKDRALLLVLIRELNTQSQSYNEKMQQITDNLITFSFAIGSLFTLGYERIAKKMKLSSKSLPSGLGVIMLMLSTFFATWAQKRATHIGRFKAKQNLLNNPEQLIYVSSKKADTIKDDDIEIRANKAPNIFKFLKEFFYSNKEYSNWKSHQNLTGKDISKAMKNIHLNQEQLEDGRRLQKNLFKTIHKIDENTQSYSSKINLLAESVKYPIVLLFGTIGSILGMKHLAKIRSSSVPKEIFQETLKYIGTISVFTIPSLIINSYFAKAQKMGARISDMITMNNLEDYRFFADYSRFKR